jgi:hypothetical protein
MRDPTDDAEHRSKKRRSAVATVAATASAVAR